MTAIPFDQPWRDHTARRVICIAYQRKPIGQTPTSDARRYYQRYLG